MFDATSRQELKERVEYEQFILREVVEIFRRIKGWENQSVVTFTDSTMTKAVSIHDRLSDSAVLDLLTKMSPVLFGTAFKTIDLMVEWLLEANGEMPSNRRQWRFAEKGQILADQRGKLQRPDEFSGTLIISDIFDLYASLILPRHAIVHGAWGSVSSDGDLQFNWTDAQSGQKLQATFSRDQVLNLAYISTQMVHIISTGSFDYRERHLLDWHLDETAPLRNKVSSGMPRPNYHHIVVKKQKETPPLVIDLKEIQETLALQGMELLDLSVEALIGGTLQLWKFPAGHLPYTASLALDESMDRYRVK